MPSIPELSPELVEVILSEHQSHKASLEPFSYRRAVTEENSFNQDALNNMMALQPLYEIWPRFESHRSFLGPVLNLAKKLISHFLIKFLPLVQVRQMQLNAHQCMMGLKVLELEDRVKKLELQLKTLNQ